MRVVDCTYRHGSKGNAAPASVIDRDLTFRPTVETFDGLDAESDIIWEYQTKVCTWPDAVWEFVTEHAMKRTGRPHEPNGIPLGEIYAWADLKAGAVRSSNERDAYGNPLGKFRRRFWFGHPIHHTPEELIAMGCVLVERRSISVGKPSVPMPEPVPARK